MITYFSSLADKLAGTLSSSAGGGIDLSFGLKLVWVPLGALFGLEILGSITPSTFSTTILLFSCLLELKLASDFVLLSL